MLRSIRPHLRNRLSSNSASSESATKGLMNLLPLPIPENIKKNVPEKTPISDAIEYEVSETVQLLLGALCFNEITNDERKEDEEISFQPDYPEDEFNNEGLDPRVTVELDILNQRNDAINKLELELGDAKQSYTEMIHEANAELELIEQKLGSCVANTQLYYDTFDDFVKVRISYQAAQNRFERSQRLYLSIEEFIDQIESFRMEEKLSAMWDRTLNDAISKVQEVKREKAEADEEVQRNHILLNSIQETLVHAEKGLKRSIKKAKPFYDRKAELHVSLKSQLNFIKQLEKCVTEAKHEYNNALRKLEHISNEIHNERKTKGLGNNGNNCPVETTPHQDPL